MNAFRTLALASLGALCFGGNAVADAIDGNWCHPDGRRMSIRGPQITTPGGALLQGNYDRHHFNYVTPAGEPGAGEPVNMILQSEYVVHVRQGGPDAPLQVWNRCSATISDARNLRLTPL